MSPGSTMLATDWVAPTDRLSTLPPWLWDPMDPSAPRTLGWAAAAWCEGWQGFPGNTFSGLIQPNGPRAKSVFKLTRDQLVFLLWWYALDDQAQWLFYHGVRRLAKGSGKSPFAAVLALIELCAPVRLERFDDRMPGGCVGKPVDMPWIQIAATAESQTKNTMRMVRAFAPKGSKVALDYALDPGKTIYYKEPEGLLEVITSSFTAAEGAESSLVVADETEHWKPSNGGPDLAATLEDNLAKSGSRLLETANAWVPGQGTVAESSWDAWVAQEEGQLKDDRRILYDARIAPPDTDMEDYDSLVAALRHVYGDCEWKRGPDGLIDVSSIVTRIWSPKSKPSESKRKYLNRPSVHEDAWVEPEQWSALFDPERQVDPTEDVVIFFDGSKSRDATAFVGCCVSDGHVFVPLVLDSRWSVWEPDPSHDTDDVVPVAMVDLAASEIFDRHNVVAFFADVQEWESFTKVEWPKRFAEQLQIMAVPAGKDPQAIAWDMRSHSHDFTMAAELAEAEIVDAKFTHDGNPVLTRHVANCRRAPNRWGISVAKESKDSPLKIDAGVCMIGARMVRRLFLASDKKPKNDGVVYL